MDSAVYPPVIKDGNIGKWTIELGDFPIPTNLSSVRGFSVAIFDYQRVSHISTACRSHFSNHLYIREAITRIPHISTIIGSSLIGKRVHSFSFQFNQYFAASKTVEDETQIMVIPHGVQYQWDDHPGDCDPSAGSALVTAHRSTEKNTYIPLIFWYSNVINHPFVMVYTTHKHGD